MREIDENLASHLSTGATTLCRTWLIKRVDGVEIGFTDHDRSLEIDGVTYIASSGMDAQAVQTTGGLSVNNSAAVGALSDSGISEEDISLGKYDNAEVFHSLVNWQDTDQSLMQFRGYLGDIKRGEGVFEVELRGLTEKLNQPNGRNYARHCGHNLGDSKCGVDKNSPQFKAEATVTFISSTNKISVSGLDGYELGWFSAGSVIWTGGNNVGASSAINLDHFEDEARVLNLWDETAQEITVGDTLTVFAGCWKSARHCLKKFDNLLNFGGFPYLPGEDWSVAYPVQNKNLDGQSLYGNLFDE